MTNAAGPKVNRASDKGQPRAKLTKIPPCTHAVPAVLSLGSPAVQVASPASIAGVYQFGTASFGRPFGDPNVSGHVVGAVDAADGAGPTTTDGCSPFTNAGAMIGRIALVERGVCGFSVKARHASDAGAVAVIIDNNAANVGAAPPAMGGDPIHDPFVLIPVVSAVAHLTNEWVEGGVVSGAQKGAIQSAAAKK